ncbi:MAG: cob(I)alamin adenosyltransferase, partial [Ilumatobacter sp.]
NDAGTTENDQGDAAIDPETGELAPRDDPRPDGLRRADSLVVVNTGNGKGKSSSAFGMMVRALARDWNVAVVQFIKSGKWNTGEEKMGIKLGVHWIACGEGFTWDSDDLSNDKRIAAEGWEQAKEILAAGEHQLVIFDELTYLATYGWLDINEIIDPIRDRPRHVNVIVTGRDAAPELIELADTVTEMTEIKHAYKSGIRAMRGIDF